MDEKILIKSKQSNVKLISLLMLLIGVLAFIVVWNIETSSGFYAERIEDGQWDYVLTSMVPYFASITILPFAGIALLFYFWFAPTSLTVTDKRVYGKAAFGKRVDLPLDKISAVGTGLFKTVSVSTSSGAIKFSMIANNNEIHTEISKLMLERQETPVAAVAHPTSATSSNADKLKKFKELLDAGIITQEEFDTKKKQLLGL